MTLFHDASKRPQKRSFKADKEKLGLGLTVAVYAAAGLVLLLILITILLFLSLLTQGAWNYGVSEAVQAFGGPNGNISFTTAIWITIALAILKNFLVPGRGKAKEG